MIIAQTGVGVSNGKVFGNDRDFLPMQLVLEAGVSAKINGRVNTAAPWVELVEVQAAGDIFSVSYCPYIQLEVTAGAGKATLYVAEV